MNRLLGFLRRSKPATEIAEQGAKKKGSMNKWLAGTGIAGGIGALLYARRDDEEPKIETQTTQQQTAQQNKTNKPTPHKASKTQPSTQPIAEQPQSEGVVGAFIPELLRLYQISNALAVQYEQDANAFYQIYQAYEKKLEELLPVMAVEMMKTPLSQITGADLPSKISTLFRYYSWDFAVENFPKILKGYYLVKIHNKDQDTSNLTINDLIAVAENPALAQNENAVKLLELIGEQYKLKMQNALGMIGKLKDVYSYKLQTLKEQSNMIKEMVKSILDQEELNFKKWLGRKQVELKEKQLAIDSAYKSAKIAQGWEALKLKREQKLLGNTPSIGISEEE
jgi:hypothetical protein